jgi:hypothetical protein
MESPRSYLERRSAEIDRALADCVQGLTHREDTAEFVREHPFAALGCSAVAGLFAARLLVTPLGKSVHAHLLRSTAALAALAMKHGPRTTAPANDAAEPTTPLG